MNSDDGNFRPTNRRQPPNEPSITLFAITFCLSFYLCYYFFLSSPSPQHIPQLIIGPGPVPVKSSWASLLSSLLLSFIIGAVVAAYEDKVPSTPNGVNPRQPPVAAVHGGQLLIAATATHSSPAVRRRRRRRPRITIARRRRQRRNVTFYLAIFFFSCFFFSCCFHYYYFFIRSPLPQHIYSKDGRTKTCETSWTTNPLNHRPSESYQDWEWVCSNPDMSGRSSSYTNSRQEQPENGDNQPHDFMADNVYSSTVNSHSRPREVRKGNIYGSEPVLGHRPPLDDQRKRDGRNRQTPRDTQPVQPPFPPSQLKSKQPNQKSMGTDPIQPPSQPSHSKSEQPAAPLKHESDRKRRPIFQPPFPQPNSQSQIQHPLTTNKPPLPTKPNTDFISSISESSASRISI